MKMVEGSGMQDVLVVEVDMRGKRQKLIALVLDQSRAAPRLSIREQRTAATKRTMMR